MQSQMPTNVPTMQGPQAPSQVPPQFIAALEAIRAAPLPPQLEVEEIPAPTRVSPFAVALEAAAPDPNGDPLATGSLVLLHQPGGHVVWGGEFRIVTVARADLEAELGADPFLPEVAWSYLTEALDLESLPMKELAGTVTRTLSESFGALRLRGGQVGVEVRASWTPNGPDVGGQLVAWLRFLAQLGGLELLPEGVALLRPPTGGLDVRTV
jgi:hypothetical protein